FSGGRPPGGWRVLSAGRSAEPDRPASGGLRREPPPPTRPALSLAALASQQQLQRQRRGCDVTLRFGTDGVRGVANLDLTPELVVALGRAAARVLNGDHFVIGRDTRVSGPLLEAALAAGLASEGVAVQTMGAVPTPVVAWTAG